MAIVRGLARTETKALGNFWADLIRCNLYLLLPLTLFYSIFLVSQGVIQNLQPYTLVTTLEGLKQSVAQGPAAAFVSMKLLGTNGGGFFNANSAHPLENPTAFGNFTQILAMLLIPSAFPLYLGRAVNHKRHGRALWLAMALAFVAAVIACTYFEDRGNPLLAAHGTQDSRNLEGKELRLGLFGSSAYAIATTASGTGAVNSMLDSFTPLGGMFPLVNMLTGEVIFGGVGSGLYGMVLFVILTIFIAGLMIGRTPEYLGKKIQTREIKFATLALIVPALLVLSFSAVATQIPLGLAALGNPGAHGFTEIFYAYSSATMNNGSTFSGLSTNSVYWNYSLALVLFFGRYFTLIPMLAIGGSMARKKICPESSAAFPAYGALFILLLFSVIALVGALTFFPALVLGPVAEHFKNWPT